MSEIEIITDGGCHRHWTAADKLRIVEETLDKGASISVVARRNGMAEAFVNTLKRDYVSVSPLPDAETALRLIPGWFEDYNENHPHSGLRMRSPREFIRAQSATA